VSGILAPHRVAVDELPQREGREENVGARVSRRTRHRLAWASAVALLVGLGAYFLTSWLGMLIPEGAGAVAISYYESDHAGVQSRITRSVGWRDCALVEIADVARPESRSHILVINRGDGWIVPTNQAEVDVDFDDLRGGHQACLDAGLKAMYPPSAPSGS
jgi:hypothetical protein